jgi:hypothetical protein
MQRVLHNKIRGSLTLQDSILLLRGKCVGEATPKTLDIRLHFLRLLCRRWLHLAILFPAIITGPFP